MKEAGRKIVVSKMPGRPGFSPESRSTPRHVEGAGPWELLDDQQGPVRADDRIAEQRLVIRTTFAMSPSRTSRPLEVVMTTRSSSSA